ncbi:MAG: ATP-binding cassette domain-containing protein [Lachnospira eligens]
MRKKSFTAFHLMEGGKALGLLGRNGAGKTTTIRIIMDVFHANSGEIFLDGKNLIQRSIL